MFPEYMQIVYPRKIDDMYNDMQSIITTVYIGTYKLYNKQK